MTSKTTKATQQLMDVRFHIEVIGLVKDPGFHLAVGIAEHLQKKFPNSFTDPKVRPLLEFDWLAYLYETKRNLRGDVWQYPDNFMCFLNGHLLGNEVDLAKWAKTLWNFTLVQPYSYHSARTDDYYIQHLHRTGHKFVFMDINFGGDEVGRLLLELFSDVCPRTSKNFEALCTGEEGLSMSGEPLCYKGSIFHRIVPNGWVQGGDISPEKSGNGGESIFGSTFEDESFAISHNKRGILGMANEGLHTNGSQFYITLQPTLWMDKTYVAFGRVVEGVKVLRRLEEVPTCNERPKNEVTIVDCGVYQP